MPSPPQRFNVSPKSTSGTRILQLPLLVELTVFSTILVSVPVSRFCPCVPKVFFRDNANANCFFFFHRHVLYDPLSVNLGLLGFFKKMRVEPIKHQCIPSWLPFCIHNLAVLHQWVVVNNNWHDFFLFFFFLVVDANGNAPRFLILLFQALSLFCLSIHPSILICRSTFDNRQSTIGILLSLPHTHT